MSTQIVYRIACDGPGCTRSSLDPEIHHLPEGWIRVSSTVHLDRSQYPSVRQIGRGTKMAWHEITEGAFHLHLCPDHWNAFADHNPRTTATGPRSKSLGRSINVACSCGAKIPWQYNMNALTPDQPGPKRAPERAWWSHLPDDLKGYALR